MTFSNVVHMSFDKKNFAAPNTLLPQTLTEISHSLRRRMARGAAPSMSKNSGVTVQRQGYNGKSKGKDKGHLDKGLETWILGKIA